MQMISVVMLCLSHLLPHQIEKREKEDPDQIDDMPEDPYTFDNDPILTVEFTAHSAN
ncbi:hypothetical protein D3C86_2221590 [compost metagenome]